MVRMPSAICFVLILFCVQEIFFLVDVDFLPSLQDCTGFEFLIHNLVSVKVAAACHILVNITFYLETHSCVRIFYLFFKKLCPPLREKCHENMLKCFNDESVTKLKHSSLLTR